MSQIKQIETLADETLDSSLLDIESISECHYSFYSQTSELTTDDILDPITAKLQAIDLAEPSSPSVKSTHSSKRLEWDSGADVGYQNIVAENVGAQLCTIEKMALSRSATRLCFDEDDRSESLLSRIDHLLQRHNRKPAFADSTRTTGNVRFKNKESRASSLTSVDTVVMVPKILVSEDVPSRRDEVPRSPIAEPEIAQTEEACATGRTSVVSDFPLLPESPQNLDVQFTTYPPPGNQPNEVEDIALRETEDETTDYPDESESIVSVKRKTSPGTVSVSSKTAKLKVYRTFREHLQSLSQYVTQLEKTWDFLAESESERERAASSLSSARAVTVESTRKTRAPRHPSRTSGSAASSSKSSKVCVERLDLRDLVSTSESLTPSTMSTDTKKSCCSHCPVKSKMKKRKDGFGYRPAEMIPQREAVAFTVDLGRNSSRTPTSQSLQEAFRSRRNDFINRCEQRQQVLRRATEWRLQNVSDNREHDREPSQPPPHLFTYSQLRQQTETLYRKLPEAQDSKRTKELEQQRSIKSRCNRSTAFIFQKRLQQQVLKGQVAFSHTTRLLSGC